ncbi:hypothetical protein D3273_21075 [Lichenibacterium minor]|uniref:Uncharacterized protein n=1 Tax=Lichenibacterium minor TaxID=2316528 RepID=A0A4Q2U1R6_9HYPH|nr:hypothetical protein [Lichenibacterium minor]RYC30030.1 hypothetical protein D3273_21075 [Lichenibacterium minor]
MPALDDAFLRFLLPLSGQEISFLPGNGGFEDALNSLAFQELCGRYQIAFRPFAESEDRTVVVGSVAVAIRWRAGLQGRRSVVLPSSARRFEDLGAGFDAATTVFWRDRLSVRMAELQGAEPERAVLCHDLAVHLDVEGLISDPVGESGRILIDIDGSHAAGNHDRISLRFVGDDDRWASLDRCRDAVWGVAGLMAHRADVGTGSPGLAILAAKMGKAVRLDGGADRVTEAIFDDTILPLYPAVTLDRGDARVRCRPAEHDDAPGEENPDAALRTHTPDDDVARLKTLLKAARRDAQFLEQERDRLVVAAADARSRHDDEAVTVVRAHRDAKRRAEEAERHTADSFADFKKRAADEADAAEARHRELTERFAAVEGKREAAVDAAAARDVAARDFAARVAADREVAEREAAAREAALHRRLADLDVAFDTRTHQALDLQSALDALGARALATEGRVARMRALIDARTAMGEDARRDAEALRRRLDDVLLSTSWRVTRPLRALTRIARHAVGARHGGRDG